MPAIQPEEKKMNTFMLDSGKKLTGTRFFFVGGPDNFRVVKKGAVLAPDGSPAVDGLLGSILMEPGKPGRITIEIINNAESAYRTVEDWYQIGTAPTADDAAKILAEELSTFGDAGYRWHEPGNGLTGAVQVATNRQAAYDQRRREKGWKTIAARLDPDSLAALDRAAEAHGGDRSAAIRALLNGR